jgi:hypothetical protein
MIEATWKAASKLRRGGWIDLGSSPLHSAEIDKREMKKKYF